MARIGRRSLRRTEEGREVYWCVCHDPDHYLTIWVPDDDSLHEAGEFEISFGHQNLSLRTRLSEALNLLLGRPGRRAWLMLNYADGVVLRDSLNKVLGRIEQLTKPE